MCMLYRTDTDTNQDFICLCSWWSGRTVSETAPAAHSCHPKGRSPEGTTIWLKQQLHQESNPGKKCTPDHAVQVVLPWIWLVDSQVFYLAWDFCWNPTPTMHASPAARTGPSQSVLSLVKGTKFQACHGSAPTHQLYRSGTKKGLGLPLEV